MPQAAASPDVAGLAQRFETDGFVLVESLLTPDMLARASAAVAWGIKNREEAYKWIRQRTYEWFEPHPVMVELIEHPLVIDFARATLGPDFHVIAAQCSRNTREDHYAPGAMNIHQDAVFFSPRGQETPGVPLHRYGFSAMFYLQDTPLEMGPTQLIPGSHQRNEPHRDGPETDALVWKQGVPAGSLLIFNHRTWHRGAPNQTGTPRDLITNAYARREITKCQIMVKQADGTEKYVPCAPLLASGSALLRQLLG